MFFLYFFRIYVSLNSDLWRFGSWICSLAPVRLLLLILRVKGNFRKTFTWQKPGPVRKPGPAGTEPRTLYLFFSRSLLFHLRWIRRPTFHPAATKRDRKGPENPGAVSSRSRGDRAGAGGPPAHDQETFPPTSAPPKSWTPSECAMFPGRAECWSRRGGDPVRSQFLLMTSQRVKLPYRDPLQAD